MAERDQKEMSSPLGEQRQYYSEDDDGISLKDLILTLWGYRRAIVLLSLGATILIIAIAGFIFLGQTKESVAKLQFKLDFQGVDKGEYPNGMKFSTSDILSMPVMNKVYEEDNLQQYMEFPDFRASLAVIQISDALRFLEYEYATRLSDKKLNVDQRTRLETEFLEKRKNALIPVYNLMWDQPMASVPPDQVAKTLNDILRAWAEYADRVKGANEYQISLVSRNILSKEDVEHEDYYIAMDMLRLTIKRIKEDIEKLEGIPGAKTLKIGKNRLSLSDLKYRMDDAENFKLNPLIGLIRQTGVTKNKEMAIGYLKNRIFELNLQNEEAVATINVYEGSLSKYVQKSVNIVPAVGADSPPPTSSLKPGLLGNVPAMIPQLGASFLTSVIDMALENSDAKFRQEITVKVIDVGIRKVSVDGELTYYKRLYEQITDPQNGVMSNSFVGAASARVKGTMETVFNMLSQTIDEINTMYLELSKINLNPDSLLYNVTEPVVMATQRPLTPKKFLMYVILTWILAQGMIVFGVLIANVFAKPPVLNKENA